MSKNFSMTLDRTSNAISKLLSTDQISLRFLRLLHANGIIEAFMSMLSSQREIRLLSYGI